MAISVYNPIYPQFPSNKKAITILRNNGLNMTVIEDVPKDQRRRPITDRCTRGDRVLHKETLVLEKNPSLKGDNSTSYHSEFSGKNVKICLPVVAQSYPKQLKSHFEIGVGSEFHGDTTASLNYGSKLHNSAKVNDEYASIANMSYQRYGASMRKVMRSDTDFPDNRTTIYRQEVLSGGPFKAFTGHQNTFQPQFSSAPVRRNILTWAEDSRRNTQPDNFRRVSGNRILTQSERDN